MRFSSKKINELEESWKLGAYIERRREKEIEHIEVSTMWAITSHDVAFDIFSIQA